MGYRQGIFRVTSSQAVSFDQCCSVERLWQLDNAAVPTELPLRQPHLPRFNLAVVAFCQAKHRVRFFQLVDVFLASGLVPAYTAAAFAKRFARLAIAAPPAGAMVAVAFVHNLLRRHPACNILLHRWAASNIGAYSHRLDLSTLFQCEIRSGCALAKLTLTLALTLRPSPDLRPDVETVRVPSRRWQQALLNLVLLQAIAASTCRGGRSHSDQRSTSRRA